MSRSKEEAHEYNQAYYQKNKSGILAKKSQQHKAIYADPIAKLSKQERQRLYDASPHGRRVRREYQLQRAHGIGIAKHDEMLAKQGGVCAICKCNRPKGCSTKNGHLYVDHDHVTGKIRGLLCNTCNVHLSSFDNYRTEMEGYLDSPGQ